MTFTGEVTLMNQSLAAGSPGGDWAISIRRVDGKADHQFTEYNRKPVTPAVIAKFIPNWRALKWKEVKGITPLPRESFAADEKYNINIVVREGATLSHEERQSQFIAFMESETASPATRDTNPLPESPDAIAQGCTCSIARDGQGNPYLKDGKPLLSATKGCPVHHC